MIAGVKLASQKLGASFWIGAAVLLIAVIALGVHGMGRSLFLDEAWVANSIREPSLDVMFRYPGWLQTSPPLFLLIARADLHLAGDSNAAFRAVPLCFGVLAAGAMLAAGRLLLRPATAFLAAAIVAFDPDAIYYSHTLKPYSGELAASAFLLLAAIAYLQRPTGRRFGWLLAATAIALPLAYPMAFLAPGVLLAVMLTGPLRRSVSLAAIAGGELLLMYWLNIRPNLAPELREFWEANRGVSPGLTIALIFCLAEATRAGWVIARRKPLPRDWARMLCALPCLLLAAAGVAGWYPVSHRTRLFALPCFVLLAMMAVEDLLDRWYRGRAVDILAMGLAAAVAVQVAAAQVIQPANTAEEDFEGAVSFLETHAGAPDLILVHACCKEGFELYRNLDDWDPPHLAFGDTGYPCCARGKNAGPKSSSEQAVFADLDAKVPRGYSGRVWLLFSTRPTHWDYTGLDEGELWRKHLWERGCPPGPFLRFANLAISPMDCASAR